MRRAAFVLMLLCSPVPARSQDSMGALLQKRDWAAVEARAAVSADPLAPRLARYLRLLTPRAASADEIDRFMREAPEWPQQTALARRYDEAVAGERDDGRAAAACGRRLPGTAAGLLRCAEALPGSDSAAAARAAWLVGITDAAGEAAFMRRWGGTLTAEDQRARFERLAWTQKAEPGGVLARQAVRVDAGWRPVTEARLALRRDDPAGGALFAALPAAAQGDPGLVLDLLRWQRRAGREPEAARVWGERGLAAEAAAPAERQRLFWEERTVLARALLRAHADGAAFAVASMASAGQGDLLFLSGWIALRRLDMADVAGDRFPAAGGSAITQARGYYWLGRARAAAGRTEEAEAAYRQAAALPTTYYGQLASLALGEGMAGLEARIGRLADPAWDEASALELTGSVFGRAAALLTEWGEARQARPFLEKLEGDAGERALVARFATALGLPEAAVGAARRAASQGMMLPGLGWPEPVQPPEAVERAVALGLIRQESSFDAAAGSPVGAQGLMQLMPGTAADLAKTLHEPAGALTDPVYNMRLGTAYLAGLLERFGALPPALAGYNAGPGRTREWLNAFGDPATGAVDPIDWIELIPFGETRDYVQRVIENVVMYRARHAAGLPHPVLRWAGSGT